MQVSQTSLSELIPYINNSRTHSDQQVSQIAASIKEFGFNNPILIDGDNGIIAGHGRVLAARKLGMGKVPTIELSHLTESQRKAYIIADNKLALNADWDMEMLSLEMGGLNQDGFDLSLIGFNEDELANIFVETTEGLTDPDEVPEVPDEPVTKEGDVWLLGKHRLMCGDSTSIDAVDKLMDGQKADMVFTDPPYNVDYSGRGKNNLGAIQNDAMGAEDFDKFCRGVFSTLHIAMKPLACIYVCHPDSQSAPKISFETAFAEAFKKSSTIIWVKQSAGMGWQDYRAQHEPILYGWKEGSGKHYFCGDRSKTTVWDISRDAQATYKHPTQKPVALPKEAVLNSSKGEDVVLDVFSGSGSTIIAGEMTGRSIYAMELSPQYCDVAVERWQNFTGERAELEGSGENFPLIKEAV